MIPSEVAEIGAEAFRGCAFSNVTIPSGVTKIGDKAFYMCESLIEIVIPDGVTEFGASVFSGCSALKNVTIGSGVSRIDNMFELCTSLESVTFRAPISYFYTNAFLNYTTENITLNLAAGQKQLTENEYNPGVEYELKDGTEDFSSGTEFCGLTFKEIIISAE